VILQWPAGLTKDLAWSVSFGSVRRH